MLKETATGENIGYVVIIFIIGDISIGRRGRAGFRTFWLRLLFSLSSKCNCIFIFQMPWSGYSEVTCGQRVKLPPSHLSTTFGGGFAPSSLLNIKC